MLRPDIDASLYPFPIVRLVLAPVGVAHGKWMPGMTSPVKTTTTLSRIIYLTARPQINTISILVTWFHLANCKQQTCSIPQLSVGPESLQGVIRLRGFCPRGCFVQPVK